MNWERESGRLFWSKQLPHLFFALGRVFSSAVIFRLAVLYVAVIFARIGEGLFRLGVSQSAAQVEASTELGKIIFSAQAPGLFCIFFAAVIVLRMVWPAAPRSLTPEIIDAETRAMEAAARVSSENMATIVRLATSDKPPSS